LAVIAAAALLAATPAIGHAEGGTAVVGWGDNYPDEELGAGYRESPGFEPSPVLVLGLSGVTALASAGNSSFALLANGTVRSWGSDAKGQLGNGNSEHEPSGSPVKVVERTSGGEVRELKGVTAIAASYGADTHVMALVDDGEHEGEVMTWGASEYGERGNGQSGFEKEGETVPRYEASAVPDLKHVIAIAAGGNSDFALQEEDGTTTLWAWGENRYGKLGTDETGPDECEGEAAKDRPCSTTPKQVDLPTGVKVTAISSGKEAAYAVLSNGTVLAWGSNAHGELGNGTATESAVPEYVCASGSGESCSHLKEVTAVSGGNLFALALREDGEVVAWGSNGAGELGGTSSEECAEKTEKTCQKIPKAVSGLTEVSAISAGSSFSLALSGGKVYSWGNNERGQLGDGKEEGPETCVGEAPCSRTPTAIEGLSDIGGIAAGGSETGEAHSFAYLLSGSGPAPLASLTAEEDKLTAHWTFSAPEIKLRWKLATEKAWSTSVNGEASCSAEHPCHYTVTGLTPGDIYEVQVTIYNAEKELGKHWTMQGTPLG
jgi:alpha-tubulin suppressor-like RCC1 family protein